MSVSWGCVWGACVFVCVGVPSVSVHVWCMCGGGGHVREGVLSAGYSVHSQPAGGPSPRAHLALL